MGIQKKVNHTEGELDKSETRAEIGEIKTMEMEEELRVVANNLKSLEVSEAKSNAREKADKQELARLTAMLKKAESRAEFAEKSVTKLQNEADKLDEDLLHEQDKLK